MQPQEAKQSTLFLNENSGYRWNSVKRNKHVFNSINIYLKTPTDTINNTVDPKTREKLLKLKDLYKNGIIDKEIYKEKARELLENL